MTAVETDRHGAWITADWPERWARLAPDRVAIKDAADGRTWTWAQVNAATGRLAFTLRHDHSIGAGDRVAVLARNRVETVLLFFATARLGAVLVPLNFRLSAAEMRVVLADAGPALLYAVGDLRDLAGTPPLKILGYDDRDGPGQLAAPAAAGPELAAVPHAAAAADAPCMLLYTSGTTGLPKGVIITPGMIFWNTLTTVMRLGLSSADVTAAFAPFFHTSGWNVLTLPLLYCGARVVFLERFDPEQVLATLETEKVTVHFGVPTMMDMQARSPRFASTDLRSIRFALVGGEAMPETLIRIWSDRGVPVRQGYGLTEFGPNCYSLAAADAVRKIGSIGQPNWHVEARLVDDEGNVLAGPAEGELELRGPAATPGYWRQPEATAALFRDGWLRTGDVLRRDAEGFWFVTGRKKDMYISGGENVYPAEIERVLRLIPGVIEAAVIGVPDPKWGEVGCAFIVNQPGQGPTDEELLAHCSGHLARYKIPRTFRRLDCLPKADNGKILKRALNPAISPVPGDVSI